MIYCDNHILIWDKPAGIATQDHGDKPGLESLVKLWVKKKFNKPGAVFLVPTHRIDKPVSGLVLFARTSKALSRLQEMMRNREIRKTYEAKVSPRPRENEAVLIHYLAHDEYRAHVEDVPFDGSKYAELSYKCLSQESGNIALLQVELVTGRYHQIRAQLAHIGSPILGDKKYGSSYPYKPNGIALVAKKLQFIHPVSKIEIHVKSLL